MNNLYESGTTYLQVFCIGCYVQNMSFHLLALTLSYQLIKCLFEAFQFYARTSHPLKKCCWKSRAYFAGNSLTQTPKMHTKFLI